MIRYYIDKDFDGVISLIKEHLKDRGLELQEVIDYFLLIPDEDIVIVEQDGDIRSLCMYIETQLEYDMIIAMDKTDVYPISLWKLIKRTILNNTEKELRINSTLNKPIRKWCQKHNLEIDLKDIINSYA